MSEDKTEEIAEDVKSDNLTETDEPVVNNCLLYTSDAADEE